MVTGVDDVEFAPLFVGQFAEVWVRMTEPFVLQQSIDGSFEVFDGLNRIIICRRIDFLWRSNPRTNTATAEDRIFDEEPGDQSFGEGYLRFEAIDLCMNRTS